MRVILVCGLLALAACSGAVTDEKSPAAVALVELAKAERAQIQETVQLYGTADPGTSGSAILSAPQEAIVAAIDVPAGSAVVRGQVVVRLVPSPNARLDLIKAESDARAAQLAYARAQRLRSDGLVSNAEVETARAAAQSATASRASLAGRNAALSLRSPVAGHVETIAAGPGSLVAAGAPVVTVARTGDLRARFGVDPAIARRIPTGASVRVMPSSGGSAFTVPVLSVDPFVDPQTRLASVFVRLPEAARIGAGEPLTGAIAIARTSDAPTIPYAALLDEGGQPYVYLVAGGTAHRRDVEVGPTNGQRVAVLGGLAAGDLVVVQGGTALEDGMKVRTK